MESLKTNRAKRAKHGEIFVEGIESIKQLLKSNLEITRIITTAKKSFWAEEVIGRYSGSRFDSSISGTKIIEISGDLYRKLCDKNDPSEMLVTAKMPVNKLPFPDTQKNPFIIVLDRPSDSGNLGSIIRSANAFNVDTVLIMGHGVDPWDPKTIRASLGGIFFNVPVQLRSFPELLEYINALKTACGLKILGTDSAGAVSLDKTALKRPLMLILGNEAKGMSQALKSVCDGIIAIPVSGNVNSLNISCAAGIFMWEEYKNSV